jgi:hypothetical protein
VPDAQAKHDSLNEAGEKDPGEHSSHLEAREPLKAPARHTTHAAVPGTFAAFPLSQFVHVVEALVLAKVLWDS